MKVTIELMMGPNHDQLVTPQDVQVNIAALERAINGKTTVRDDVLIMDAISILRAIAKELKKDSL